METKIERPIVVKELRHSRRMLIVGLSLCVAVAVAILITILSIGKEVIPAQADAKEAVKSLDGWTYRCQQSQEADGAYSVNCDYASTTKAEVEAAASALNRAAQKLASGSIPFQATLVFARPITVEEFVQFVHQTGIVPTASTLRAYDQQKTTLPITMGIGPAQNGEPLDVEALERNSKGRSTLRIAGVFSTDVVLDKTTYVKVRLDTRVYAIDTLAYITHNSVSSDHPSVKDKLISTGVKPLYPEMEKVGIAPKE